MQRESFIDIPVPSGLYRINSNCNTLDHRNNCCNGQRNSCSCNGTSGCTNNNVEAAAAAAAAAVAAATSCIVNENACLELDDENNETTDQDLPPKYEDMSFHM